MARIQPYNVIVNTNRASENKRWQVVQYYLSIALHCLVVITNNIIITGYPCFSCKFKMYYSQFFQMYVVIHYSESDFDIHCCIVICMFTYNEVGEATCGSVAEDKFTWDMTANNNLSWENQYKPKMRFDRLYLTPYGMDTAHPVKFELIGKDHVVGCERYPSNHWGMWAEFSIRHGKDTTV